MEASTFAREQRRVAAGMAGAVLASALALGLWWAFGPVAPTGLVERLTYALTWDLALAAALAGAVARIAAGRFFSREDIAGAGFAAASPRIAHARAVLQNTTEQALLAALVHLALAAGSPM